MSYRTMLKHRAVVKRLEESNLNGYVLHDWQVKSRNVPCFLDLNFIRRGKDPMWTPEAGRPSDRTGVFFTTGDVDVRSGDRVEMTRGPSGTFQIEGAVDEAWRPDAKHHLELGVKEVPNAITAGEET